MDDACHRHVIWGWNRGDATYTDLEEETRCLYYSESYTEVDAQAIYQGNIQKAQGRMVYMDWGGKQQVYWPGHQNGYMTPFDKYIVAILRWNPGMSAWDWQQWTEVVPDVKQFSMSAQDQQTEKQAFAGLDQQVVDLPPPPKDDSTKGSTIALVVGGVTTVIGLLWLALRGARKG